jgi:HEAT repeat protein
MPRVQLTVAAGVLAAFAGTAAAQPPQITNAAVAAQPAGTSLGDTVRRLAGESADVSWIAWSVPMIAGDRTLCCASSGSTWVNGDVISTDRSHSCGACELEPSARTNAVPVRRDQAQRTVKLEPSDTMLVLLRVADRQIEPVRIFSEDCTVDAGGRRLTWLENVSPPGSLALLESLATSAGERRDRVSDGAVSAIALHADAGADAALDRLLASNVPGHVREKVPFWLGHARGRRGLERLRRLVAEDANREVRKQAVFAISQSSEPEAGDLLIETARRHDHAEVRGEAIFWLAQKAGRKAAAAITERIEADPDTEVKKRAVFALSQLPKDEGVPLLITVARTHSNPAVRKQAMFWLGQSRDPRAVDFFAEVLGK